MAAASVFGERPVPGKAVANSGLYSGMVASRSMRTSIGMFISPGDCTGRTTFGVPGPSPTANPSPQPKPGLGQLAQDCAEVTEMRVSKYSFLPSAAFSGVYGVPFGHGITAGRRYSAL